MDATDVSRWFEPLMGRTIFHIGWADFVLLAAIVGTVVLIRRWRNRNG